MTKITSTSNLQALLNESKEWEEESKGLDGGIWVNKLKSAAQGITEVFERQGAKVKDRLKTARARLNMEVLQSKALPDSLDKADAPGLLDLLVTTARRVQSAVRDHGTILEFVREVITKNTVKIAEVSDHVESAEMQVNLLRDKVTKMDEDHKKLEEEKKVMEKTMLNEVDETRQRGLKGNIILSSPHSQAKATLLVQQTKEDGYKETELEMCLRLIEQKTTAVRLPKQDVVACHKLISKDANQHSYVLRVINRTNGSAWDQLANGMVTGKLGHYPHHINFTGDNIYLNFQLTKKRMDLTQQCRLLMKHKDGKKIAKYSVNQNGRITVMKVAGSKVWEEVKDMEKLAKISKFPLPILQERDRT
jgi:hypothetical protein